MKTNKMVDTKQLTLLALLTAIVAILAYFGGFIKIGGLASISLTLIPVVIGASVCGSKAGAWLGGVAGAVFFATADAAFWAGISLHGTVITVMVKGILSGYLAGVTYKLVEKFNRTVAVIASAIVCPVVNTAIFILGCFVFFTKVLNSGASEAGMSVASYVLIAFVGLNFVFELLSNIILSPVVVRLINVRKKI